MKGIVVYESYWGNTASVAQAIAEGLGEGARAMSTAEATADAQRYAGEAGQESPVPAGPVASVDAGMARDTAPRWRERARDGGRMRCRLRDRFQALARRLCGQDPEDAGGEGLQAGRQEAALSRQDR